MAVLFAALVTGVPAIIAIAHDDHSDYGDYDDYDDYDDAEERRARRINNIKQEIESQVEDLNGEKRTRIDPRLSDTSLIRETPLTVSKDRMDTNAMNRLNKQKQLDIQRETQDIDRQIKQIDDLIKKIDSVGK